jgi:hypothetical protein
MSLRKMSLLFVMFGIASLLLTPVRGEGKKRLIYEKDLVPIFQKSCTKCHGAKKSKGGLRLDNAKEFKTGGNNGAVAVSGDPEHSALYTLIVLPANDEDVMPAKGDVLTKKQTDLIATWIRQGGYFEDGTSLKDVAKDFEKKVDKRVSVLDKLSLDVKVPDASLIKSFKAMGVEIKSLSKNGRLLAIDFGQINKSAKITSADLSKLARFSDQLISLDLAGLKLADKDLSFLSKLKRLKHLHLANSDANDAALKHIKTLSELQTLNLYNTKVTDAGLTYLTGLKKLKNLYLWKSKATSKGAAKLKTTLKNLKISLG